MRKQSIPVNVWSSELYIDPDRALAILTMTYATNAMPGVIESRAQDGLNSMSSVDIVDIMVNSSENNVQRRHQAWTLFTRE